MLSSSQPDLKILPGETMPLHRPADSDDLPQLAMPLGGLGAGNICINAYGGFQDFAIRHRPELSARPDGHAVRDTLFATLRCPRTGTTRLCEGPMPRERIYDQGLMAQGFRRGGHEGLPRFRRARCSAVFPFATVRLDDPAMPLAVELTAWSPFVPGDDVASGVPAAILEYRLINRGAKAEHFELGIHASHPFPGAQGDGRDSRTRVLGDGSGIFMHNVEAPASPHRGSAALAVVGHTPQIKAMWFRGGWFDAISALWRELESGTFATNPGHDGISLTGRNGGSLLVTGTVPARGEVTIPVLWCWHMPNVPQVVGQAKTGDCGCTGGCTPPTWRPFYAGRWADAEAVSAWLAAGLDDLRARTRTFVDALAATTAPAPLVEAAQCNLAILKSPTVLRQENGNMWAWEGCFSDAGCCHGSCTHVWNYAQAIPQLFPAVERTLREQELLRSQDARGHINFRAALPDGPTDHGWHAAADGQLGGLMKLWRDWQTCGDEAWLRSLWPAARRSLDYAIATWDPQRSGMLVEPHHNTYDIEFWGPDPFCTSVYLGALTAMARMAEALGEGADAKVWDALAAKGAKAMDRDLFRDGWYRQQVRWHDLADRSFANGLASIAPGVRALLEREGPKYQYGTGCLSEQLIGAGWAALYGLPLPLSATKVKSALRAVVRHNLRDDLSTHANCQRPGYAWRDEGGLLVCSWPAGGKPTFPFPYSDEVWTGSEYQVATHCILAGLVDEGVAIATTARSRYDGATRNPFDEYECGSFYARALSSWGLLSAWADLRISAVERTLHLAPRTAKRPFRTIFATAGAWGMIELDGKRLRIAVREGRLALAHVVLDGRRLPWEVEISAGAVAELALPRR